MNLIYLATEAVASEKVSGKIHFWAVVDQLQQRGHRVIVVAPRFSNFDRDNLPESTQVIGVYAPGKNPFGILIFELVLAAHIPWLRRKFQPKAVLVRGGGPGWFMGLIFLLFRFAGIPVILECNGIVWRELALRGKSRAQIFNAYVSAWQQAWTCNSIIGVSKGITEAYRRLGRRRESRCRTIPNGTDPRQFWLSTAERHQARELFGISVGAFVTGYVGLFSPWHDIKGMVRAAELLQSNGHNHIKIIMVGNGELFDWASQQKTAKKLDQLMLPGPITDRTQLIRWMGCFDVGLCLSLPLEGSPLKMFEYMAAGLPVIGSGFPQILELCRRDGIGIGLSISDPNAIADAILEMSRARDYWKTVGELNRKLATEKYSWRRVAADVEEAIRDCLS